MANNLDNVDLAFKYYDVSISCMYRGFFEINKIWEKLCKLKPECISERDDKLRELQLICRTRAIVTHDRVLNGESYKGIRRNTRV